MAGAATPLWKLILKQFDDLLVKVGSLRGRQTPLRSAARTAYSSTHVRTVIICLSDGGCGAVCLPFGQILLAAAVADFIIAMSDGEGILG